MLGERIRAARRGQNKTQEDLAQHLGVKRAVISKYETGAITPTLGQIRKIAEFLNVPFGELISDSVKTIEIPMPEYAMRMPTKDEIARMSPAEQEYYSLRLLADTMPELLVRELTKAYQELNKLGQVESVIRVRELTQCTKYTESDPNNPPLKITVQFTDQENQDSNNNPPQD